ncbi:MAG: hypothetical protein AABP62_14530 [Planctomycetota bacterium]
MGKVFNGWRRKTGTITLVMALALMGGWMRSEVINDFVATDCRNATYRVGSYGGTLNLIRHSPPNAFGRFLHWDSFEGQKTNRHELWDQWNSWDGYEVEWQWNWAQFRFGAGSLQGTKTVSFVIPYWFIVIPLTLLSAYLLLATPRSLKPIHSPEAPSDSN